MRNEYLRGSMTGRHVGEEGGAYVKNIERPVKVTHLLCTTGANAMTEKMRYAAKFNQHKEANIHLIWEEWFWDSLKAGGEKFVHPTVEDLLCNGLQVDATKICTM